MTRAPAVVLACVVLSAAVAAGRNGSSPVFEPVVMADELAGQPVYCITQDRAGFLWIGKMGGMVRFDGEHAELVNPFLPTTNTPPYPYVADVMEDRQGTIWIAAGTSGLYAFEPATGKLAHQVFDVDPTAGAGSDSVTTLFEDRRGRIWVGGGVLGEQGWLGRFDPDSGAFTRYTHDPTDPANLDRASVSSIVEDASGSLWVGTSDGLSRYNAKSESFARFRHDAGDPGSLAGNFVSRLLVSEGGDLWVLTLSGLSRWLPDGGRFENHLPDPPFLGLDMAEGLDGRLWIGTTSGLVAFDPSSGAFSRVERGAAEGADVAGGWISSVYVDRSGVVWAGSLTAGLYTWDPTRIDFADLLLSPGADYSKMQRLLVTAVHEDRSGNLWIAVVGLAGERDRLQAQSVRAELFRWERVADRLSSYPLNGAGTSIVLAVGGIREDSRGTLWLATTDGLARFDRETGQPEYVELPVAVDRSDFPVLEMDRYGQLWFASGGSLVRVDPGSGRIDRHLEGTGGTKSLGVITSLLADASGRLWIGTRGSGIVVYVPETLTATPVPGTGRMAITDLHQDRSGRGWAGTQGEGLLRLDPDRGVVDRVTVHDGLPADTVQAVLEDEGGRLWLASGGGVVRFDPHSRSLRTFDASDGLPPSQIVLPGVGCAAADGALFFAGGGSLVGFRAPDVVDRPFPSPVVITSIEVSGRPHPEKPAEAIRSPLLPPDRLRLAHDLNDLSVGFTSLDFRRPGRNRFAYILEGYDGGWNHVGNQEYARYTNLDPGDYVFRVKGTNSDGVWSTTEATLAVTILPPWWRTWWAYSLLIAMGGAVAMITVRTLVARERMRGEVRLKEAEAAQLREMDRLKTRLFSNVSHEFRTPLTLLLGPLQELINEPASGTRRRFQSMFRSARRLLDLVNQLLEMAKIEAGQMRLEKGRVDLSGFTSGIIASFQSLADSRGVRLVAELPRAPIHVWIDREKMETVLTNLLANALKFTPDGGEVAVACGITEDGDARTLRLSVRDDGPGIAEQDIAHVFDRFYRGESGQHPADAGTGIGLALVREMVELHGGRVGVTSEPGAGAEFTVEVPVDVDRGIDAGHVVVEDDGLSEGGMAPADAVADGGVVVDADRPLILVVEDHPELRAYLRSFLEPFYRILEAEHGAAGLEAGVENIPDLVVSDVMMPGMDGFELCRRLKGDERTSHIPVILLTALSGVESRIEGLDTGADDYLAKPFDSRELRARIRNLIEQRRRLQEKLGSRIVSIEPAPVDVTSLDDAFLSRAVDVVEHNLDDADFSAERFAGEMTMSRMQLHRKLKALTGMSTTAFVRSYRLKRAAQLLAAGYGNVSEVSLAVGFRNPPYFTSCFQKQLGVTPSEYLSGKRP